MQHNESPTGPRDEAVTFTSPDGTWWRVHEAKGELVPGSRGVRCLCFDSAWVIRRVWNYPDDWRKLSDTDLEALSWQR